MNIFNFSKKHKFEVPITEEEKLEMLCHCARSGNCEACQTYANGEVEIEIQ